MGRAKAPTEVGLCRDQFHRYYWNGDGPLVSPTTVLKVLYSFGLEQWKLEGVARRAVRDLAILKVLVERGDEEAAVKLLLDARDSSYAARERGTAFHAWAESFNRGVPAEVPEGLEREVEGYLNWTSVARPEWLAVEAMVANLEYRFGGTFDGIAQIGGVNWLIDLKTSKSVEGRSGVWDDYRMQLAAYAHGEFIGQPNDPRQYEIPRIERFGIVHVTSGGTRLVEADVTHLDWLAFLQALAIHRYKKEAAA